MGNFLLRCKFINLRVGEDQTEIVSWRVNDIALPKSARSAVIHCGTNNFDTSNLDEISLGTATIVRSISHRHPDIEVIVSGLLPRDVHWST